MARIRHPHVIEVHDVGEVGDVDFVVMDLAEGGSLAQRVDRGGAVPPAEAARLLIEVLGALQVAHAHGIVHRDVKPQNILLGADGGTLLADFGIAQMNVEENLSRSQEPPQRSAGNPTLSKSIQAPNDW
jgi:serine/threonine protein kinase